MKRLVFITIAFISILTINAQNKWSVYTGANISHQYDGMTNTADYRWGVGAFVGVGYERMLGTKWSINPRLEYSYVNNGIKGGVYLSESKAYSGREWLEAHTLSIPILANYRISLNGNLKLRIGIGPYLQTILAGNREWELNRISRNHYPNFSDRLTVGGRGELAIEINDHFSYMIGYQFGGLKHNSDLNKVGSVNFGFGYTF